mmetsp:Transcript_3598/g.6581  ORF Transcript_3598/g.6581 Transcript_3598/m.6581 type:complete len:281 (+) Transcript_3598:547-1389(+)
MPKYTNSGLYSLLSCLEQVVASCTNIFYRQIASAKWWAVGDQDVDRSVRFAWDLIPDLPNGSSSFEVERPIKKFRRIGRSIDTKSTFGRVLRVLEVDTVPADCVLGLLTAKLFSMKPAPTFFVVPVIEGQVMVSCDGDYFFKARISEECTQVFDGFHFSSLGKVATVNQNVTSWQMYFAMLPMRVANDHQTSDSFRRLCTHCRSWRILEYLTSTNFFPCFVGIQRQEFLFRQAIEIYSFLAVRQRGVVILVRRCPRFRHCTFLFSWFISHLEYSTVLLAT